MNDMTTAPAKLDSDDPADYLGATYYVDADNEVVRRFAQERAGTGDATAKAVALYYAVRDGIRYDPYAAVMKPEYFQASHTIEAGRGFCVQKGIVMTAACRALGLAARPGYADVTNHLASQRIIDMLGSRLFVWHGYVEIYLDDRWVKCTPVFNEELCEKFNVAPLEWDGTEDSLFQPSDKDGNAYMTYENDHGVYFDLPFDEMHQGFIDEYPKAYGPGGSFAEGGDFYAEAEAAGRSVG